MKNKKLKVLIFYSCSEYPFRRNFKAFIESFEKYSNHEVTYINFPFYIPKITLKNSKWDVIVYSYSFTAPWNRSRYLNKILEIQNLNLISSNKVAFFQDEYFNLDLTNRFIKNLNIDQIYTVVPKSEWHKVYPGISEHKIKQYLTGYVEESDISLANKLIKENKRDIDICYRTAYPGPGMAMLGNIGWLKFEVADFGSKLGLPNSDIKVGSGFLTGDDWFKLLASSRFTLGVPSGANVLDFYGKISEHFKGQSKITRSEVMAYFQKNSIAQDYKLEVISPRIIEAGLLETCQILVEGEFNGLLEKYKHYIPISRELDNIEEVQRLIHDSSYVEEVVRNLKQLLIESNRLKYDYFIKNFFESLDTNKSTVLRKNLIVYSFEKLSFLNLLIYNSLIRFIKKLRN